jgi:hypothetical protein
VGQAQSKQRRFKYFGPARITAAVPQTDRTRSKFPQPTHAQPSATSAWDRHNNETAPQIFFGPARVLIYCSSHSNTKLRRSKIPCGPAPRPACATLLRGTGTITSSATSDIFLTGLGTDLLQFLLNAKQSPQNSDPARQPCATRVGRAQSDNKYFGPAWVDFHRFCSNAKQGRSKFTAQRTPNIRGFCVGRALITSNIRQIAFVGTARCLFTSNLLDRPVIDCSSHSNTKPRRSKSRASYHAPICATYAWDRHNHETFKYFGLAVLIFTVPAQTRAEPLKFRQRASPRDFCVGQAQ